MRPDTTHHTHHTMHTPHTTHHTPHAHPPHTTHHAAQVLFEMPISAKRGAMVGALMRTLRGSSKVVTHLIAVLLPRVQRRIKHAPSR